MCMASGPENKGVITKQECLDCALANGNPPCGFDYILLKYLYSKERYRKDEVHVSDILGCARQAYFAKKFKLPVEPHKQLIVSYGTIQHELLEAMEDDKFTAEQILSNSGLVGTADVVYKDGRLLDYKTTRNINKKYLPRKKHKLQVNIYAHMLRQEGQEVKSVAIQYMDFIGPSKCPTHKAFVVPGLEYPKCPICDLESPDFHMGALLCEVELMPEEEVGMIIEDSVSYLQTCLDEETIPEPTPDFLCRYCPFISWCEEGQNSIHI